MTNKIVVSLLSGGIDSCVASSLAKQQGHEVYLLIVRANEAEYRSALRVAEILDPVDIILGDIKLVSYKTNKEFMSGRRRRELDGVQEGYPPGRDPAYIHLACGCLEEILVGKGSENGSVWIAISNADKRFTDCQPEVYQLHNQLFQFTETAKTLGKNITLETPLLHMTKAEIIHRGLEINAPLDETFSCYRPIEVKGEYYQCGVCAHCSEVIEGVKGLDLRNLNPAQISTIQRYLGRFRTPLTLDGLYQRKQ